jgi:hypothetical protein
MQENYSEWDFQQFSFVSVEKASVYFSVSTRRIRKLLSDGRLVGEKTGKAWLVRYPYRLTTGRRGPHMMQRQLEGRLFRDYVPKRERNN